MTVRRSVYHAISEKDLQRYQKFVEDSTNTDFTTFDYVDLKCYMTFQDVQTADDYCGQMTAIFFRSWLAVVDPKN